MRFVHAADLHIDSPLRGLVRYEGAPVDKVRRATREAFERVVGLCLEERARYLVLAGDVFDGDWKDVGTGLFFVSQLARLRETECRVVLLRGNHDFELTKSLSYPDHVFEFGVASKGPHTFRFDEDGVAFHGVSYGSQKMPESLLPSYPKPIAGALNVGVLHTNAIGHRDHAAYAPCTVTELAVHGYQYWALGHVHSHLVLHKKPWVVYPGNTQGRSARETGEKGCVVVETEGAEVTSVRFEPTDSMRYHVVEVRLAEEDDREELFAKVRKRIDEVAASSGGRLAAVKLTVTGACRAHGSVATERESILAQLRADAIERGGDVWLERVHLATVPAQSMEALRAAKGLVSELLAWTEHLRGEEAETERRALRAALAPLKKKLARELEELKIDVDGEAWFDAVLEQAEALLAERLTEVPHA